MKNVILYINQFFGGIGGEEEADFEPAIYEGTMGPGLALQAQLEDAQITHTIVCGDNFMASHRASALEKIQTFLEGIPFDLLLAGPAFQAGRYGTSCGEICRFIQETYGKPAITSMNEENPGVDAYRSEIYILRGGANAAKMRKDAKNMAAFANKILHDREILWADKEGYFPRGERRQFFVDQLPGDRAVEMLLAKLNGKPYQTEYRIETHEKVKPAAAINVSKSKIALVTTSGLVPADNPDHIPSASATVWGQYDISDLDAFRPGEFITVHGGYSGENANADPEVLLPLRTVKKFVREGKIGELEPYYFGTTGNCTAVDAAVNMAGGIIEKLKEDHVDGVIFTST